MTTEWKDITDPEELFRLKREGWEIEVQIDAGNDKYCPFKEWNQATWSKTYLFRARPRQPTMRKIKIYGYLDTTAGHTYTSKDGQRMVGNVVVRYPKLDDEIEVPE